MPMETTSPKLKLRSFGFDVPAPGEPSVGGHS